MAVVSLSGCSEAWVSQTRLSAGEPRVGDVPPPTCLSRVQVGSCSISTLPPLPGLLPADRERPWGPSTGLVHVHEVCSHADKETSW